MTLCPIALVASCARCPAVRVCPLKTVIGDAPKVEPAPPKRRGAGPATKARRSR